VECPKDSFVDEQLKSHYSDVLYKIPVSGTGQNVFVFVLVEHKTTPEYWTMLQLLRYIVQIWVREYKAAEDQGRLEGFMLPPILPIIVYHGERPFTAPIRFGKLIRPVKGFEKYTLDFESILLDLTETNEKDLPEDLELYAVLSVMQAVFRQDVAERILLIYQKIKHKLSDPKYRERWINLLRYFMKSSKYLTTKDAIEVTSQMSDTIVAGISPYAQELMAEGVAIGREEGVAIGIEKERNAWCADKVETLLRILTKRLGEVPPTTQDKLHAIHDLDVLGQLTDVALDCQSLEEFEQALNR
jgi:predicted transposase YdaD